MERRKTLMIAGGAGLLALLAWLSTRETRGPAETLPAVSAATGAGEDESRLAPPSLPVVELAPAVREPFEDRQQPERIRLETSASRRFKANPPGPVAPVHVQLVDVRTGEPIPFFRVRVRAVHASSQPSEWTEIDGLGTPTGGTVSGHFRLRSCGPSSGGPTPGVAELGETDAEGRYVSEREFAEGIVEIELLDPPKPRRRLSKEGPPRFRHEPGAEETKLAVSIGPTYCFDIDLPRKVRVRDLFATFAPPHGMSEVYRNLYRGVSVREEQVWTLTQTFERSALEDHAPLRAGAPLWCRFRFPIDPAPAEGPYELHVRSRDGFWAGSVRVGSIVGIDPDRLPLELTPTGALEGVVLAPDGNPARVAWIQVGSGGDTPLAEGCVDAEGRFGFQWLPPGELAVRVEAPRYHEARAIASVRASRTCRVEVRLASDVPLGRIAGLLRSRTGRHRAPGGATVSLRGLDGSELRLIRRVSYEEREGEIVGPFAFEDVPAGRYELELYAEDNRPWEPGRMEVSVPAEGLEFFCEDGAPAFDLIFRAVDAATGERVESLRSLVWRGDPADEVLLDFDPLHHMYAAVPADTSLHWVVRAEGYLIVEGDESAGRLVDGTRVVELALHRGWSRLFRVVSPEWDVMAGVELVADGVSVGVTDARGLVRIERASPPETLELRSEGHSVPCRESDLGPLFDLLGSGVETLVVFDGD